MRLLLILTVVIAVSALLWGSWQWGRRPFLLTVSLVFSLMCPLGAILFAIGVNNFFEYRDVVLGVALAFSAGIFLCISLGDLLPEVHFHSHDRLKLSAMLLLGVAIAFGIEMLPGHKHQGMKELIDAAQQREIDESPRKTIPLGEPLSDGQSDVDL